MELHRKEIKDNLQKVLSGEMKEVDFMIEYLRKAFNIYQQGYDNATEEAIKTMKGVFKEMREEVKRV